MVRFAQVEKVIGSGFTTISDNSRKVEARLKSLDMKYEEMKAQIDTFKQCRKQQIFSNISKL
jgi:archaellum component FlaC